MKIVISPSKTQKLTKSSNLKDTKIIYLSKHKKILSQLRKLSKTDLKKIMKINDQLLETTYLNIKNYSKLGLYHAFESFNGLVFKGLQKELYLSKEYDYIKNNLIILDAFYGILEPGTLINPYRLDMKMKIGINLYDFWDITGYFENELVINLASNEFSKLIEKTNFINISFLQKKNDNYVNQPTYSKQERGRFLNYLILGNIEDIQKMKEYDANSYSFNSKLSDEKNIIFTRSI